MAQICNEPESISIWLWYEKAFVYPCGGVWFRDNYPLHLLWCRVTEAAAVREPCLMLSKLAPRWRELASPWGKLAQYEAKVAEVTRARLTMEKARPA